jgi:hypothetical protein
MSETLPGIGHNRPPSPLTPAEVTRHLMLSETSLVKRRDELIAGLAAFKASHPTIETEEVQGIAGDWVSQINSALALTTERFRIAKDPYVEGGRRVDSFFKNIGLPLRELLEEIKVPRTAYALKKEAAELAARQETARLATEEAARVQRELAAQEAAEAAAPAETDRYVQDDTTKVSLEEAISAAEDAERAEKKANAKPAEMSRTRGDSSVSSLREVWDVKLEDITKVPAEFLLFNDAVARKAVRAGRRAIPGVRVFSTKNLVTRG